MGLNRQLHEVGSVLTVNVPSTSPQVALPAVPNVGLPWAPSLTQSPWLANVPSAFQNPAAGSADQDKDGVRSRVV